MNRDQFGIRVVLAISLVAFSTSGSTNVAFAGPSACEPVKTCAPVKTVGFPPAPACGPVKACAPVRKVAVAPLPACAPVKVVARPVHACAPVKVYAPVNACEPVKTCEPVHEHLAALHAHLHQFFHGTWLKGHAGRYDVVQEYSEPGVTPSQPAAPPAPAPTLPKAPAPPAPTKA